MGNAARVTVHYPPIKRNWIRRGLHPASEHSFGTRISVSMTHGGVMLLSDLYGHRVEMPQSNEFGPGALEIRSL